MKKLDSKTAQMIDDEIKSIPEKYQRNFASTHEGYAVLLEEVRELEHVVFFGEKECQREYVNNLREGDLPDIAHKNRLHEEAVQIAAMACRIIQELT